MTIRTSANELFWDYRQSTAARPWSYHVVTDFADWECLACSALPPELTAARAPPGLPAGPFIGLCK
eukprot:2171370-Amphidinium_carterae.1